MPRTTRALLVAATLALAVAAPALAQGPAVPYPDTLRPEWSVEPARAGGARVVGYLYNTNIKDAANVWLRVDRLGADGAVAATYRRRVVGDVFSGSRSLFEVPVPEAGATYRVTVEAADWIKECR